MVQRQVHRSWGYACLEHSTPLKFRRLCNVAWQKLFHDISLSHERLESQSLNSSLSGKLVQYSKLRIWCLNMQHKKAGKDLQTQVSASFVHVEVSSGDLISVCKFVTPLDFR